MNAVLRPIPAAPTRALPKAMARDLLGFDALPPRAAALHAVLPAPEAEGGLSVVDSTWPAGAGAGPHRHEGADEILVVLSGLVEVRLEGRATRHGPGGTALIPRGLTHEVVAVTEARHVAVLARR